MKEKERLIRLITEAIKDTDYLNNIETLLTIYLNSDGSIGFEVTGIEYDWDANAQEIGQLERIDNTIHVHADYGINLEFKI